MTKKQTDGSSYLNLSNTQERVIKQGSMQCQHLRIFSGYFLVGLGLMSLTACQSPLWIYLRNPNDAAVWVEMELRGGGRFVDMPDFFASRRENLPSHFSFAYQSDLLPIRIHTHKRLLQRLPVELLAPDRVRFCLPPRATLYLGEPHRQVAQEQIWLRFLPPGQKTYRQVPSRAFSQGAGLCFSGLRRFLRFSGFLNHLRRFF
ncbi:MAG: hypothetical protein HC913_05865 [Microscillaceae bacterium]|nr:hypothetical protein [Microscillaceae bacterium]